MRYQVTVNGQVFDVNVEALDGAAPAPVAAAAPAPAAAPAATPAPAAAPAPAPAPAAEAAPAAASAGNGAPVESPMPGKILKIMAPAGTSVTKGQTIMILEAMKMENEIPAPCDGTVSSVNVTEGASVNTGDVLALIG